MAEPSPSITCPRCKRTSYDPSDVEQGYCGFCHWWTTPRQATVGLRSTPPPDGQMLVQLPPLTTEEAGVLYDALDGLLTSMMEQPKVRTEPGPGGGVRVLVPRNWAILNSLRTAVGEALSDG